MKEAGEAANILARNGEREGIRAQEGWSLFFRKRNAYMFGIGDPWQGHRDESNRSCFFFFFCILNQDLWGGVYYGKGPHVYGSNIHPWQRKGVVCDIFLSLFSGNITA